jgi:Uma2 family endonuclease
MGQDSAMGSTGLPAMTITAWSELDEDEPGELVDGRLEEEEVPSYLHEAIVAWFIRILGAWATARGGWVFGSESKFAVAPQRGRKADVSVYFPGARLPGKHESVARVPPQIMIEVLSPRPRDGRRDRIDKMRDYANFGVRQYWLVDPELRVLEILELGADGRYAIALTASEGGHPAPGCEGLILDLDALWAEVDRLPDDSDPPI